MLIQKADFQQKAKPRKTENTKKNRLIYTLNTLY